MALAWERAGGVISGPRRENPLLASYVGDSGGGTMAQWVRLCSRGETPGPGAVTEVECEGVVICLANVGGELHALDNICPHRQGPLGQGWVEGNAVLCPWHAWAFDVTTGVAQEPEKAKVRVFAVEIEGNDVLVDLT